MDVHHLSPGGLQVHHLVCTSLKHTGVFKAEHSKKDETNEFDRQCKREPTLISLTLKTMDVNTFSVGGTCGPCSFLPSVPNERTAKFTKSFSEDHH